MPLDGRVQLGPKGLQDLALLQRHILDKAQRLLQIAEDRGSVLLDQGLLCHPGHQVVGRLCVDDFDRLLVGLAGQLPQQLARRGVDAIDQRAIKDDELKTLVIRHVLGGILHHAVENPRHHLVRRGVEDVALQAHD